MDELAELLFYVAILPQCRCLWGDLATVSVSAGRSCHSVGVCRVILPQCRLSGPILPDLLESKWRGLRTSAVPYRELAAALYWDVAVESLRLSLSRLPWSPQRAVRRRRRATRIVFEGVTVLDAKCAYFVGVPVLSRTPPSICGFPLFAPHCRPTTTVSDKPLVIS